MEQHSGEPSPRAAIGLLVLALVIVVPAVGIALVLRAGQTGAGSGRGTPSGPNGQFSQPYRERRTPRGPAGTARTVAQPDVSALLDPAAMPTHRTGPVESVSVIEVARVGANWIDITIENTGHTPLTRIRGVTRDAPPEATAEPTPLIAWYADLSGGALAPGARQTIRVATLFSTGVPEVQIIEARPAP